MLEDESNVSRRIYENTAFYEELRPLNYIIFYVHSVHVFYILFNSK